jgi:hypothetical protein
LLCFQAPRLGWGNTVGCSNCFHDGSKEHGVTAGSNWRWNNGQCLRPSLIRFQSSPILWRNDQWLTHLQFERSNYPVRTRRNANLHGKLTAELRWSNAGIARVTDRSSHQMAPPSTGPAVSPLADVEKPAPRIRRSTLKSLSISHLITCSGPVRPIPIQKLSTSVPRSSFVNGT